MGLQFSQISEKQVIGQPLHSALSFSLCIEHPSSIYQIGIKYISIIHQAEYEDLRLHIRDAHTFKCDICEISLGNKENLDMHLLTCEIYKCFTCDYVNKRLCELKSHCKKKHEGNTFIQHFKINIDNFKEKTCKSSRSIDI